MIKKDMQHFLFPAVWPASLSFFLPEESSQIIWGSGVQVDAFYVHIKKLRSREFKGFGKFAWQGSFYLISLSLSSYLFSSPPYPTPLWGYNWCNFWYILNGYPIATISIWLQVPAPQPFYKRPGSYKIQAYQNKAHQTEHSEVSNGRFKVLTQQPGKEKKM